jgi:hypothetical protein
MMPLSRVLLISLAAVLVGCASTPRPPGTDPKTVEIERPSLGSLEHRGERHELRDLLDPAYRAGGADDFVRRFNPDTALADRAHQMRLDP